METLKTIQTLSKIGKILSNIVFVCCIVGGCLCIAGILGLAFGGDTLKLGGVTVHGLIENKEGLSDAMLYTAMGTGIVACIAEAVVAKFAEIYFRNELADGDPFTFRGAKELLRLGILTIAIPLGTVILCSIGINIVDNYYPGADTLFSGEYTTVGLGIAMIVTSLFFRYGAELKGDADLG